MVERKTRSGVDVSPTRRNTARSVVPIRLGDSERAQIARAASRLQLTLSGFVRQAALQASAVVDRKASMVSKPRDADLDQSMSERGLVVVEPEREHYVDGERVR
jgi:uncharacterized protein (DUF1778 family)